MKKFIIAFTLLFSVFLFSCDDEPVPVESTYKIDFYGWEDSAAYFINYTKDATSFGYDTFYHNFSHEFEAFPEDVDSLYFDCTDTLKRFLEVIFTVDNKEVYRKSEQAGSGYLKASWIPEK
jgi:hypothetical protein